MGQAQAYKGVLELLAVEPLMACRGRPLVRKSFQLSCCPIKNGAAISLWMSLPMCSIFYLDYKLISSVASEKMRPLCYGSMERTTVLQT